MPNLWVFPPSDSPISGYFFVQFFVFLWNRWWEMVCILNASSLISVRVSPRMWKCFHMAVRPFKSSRFRLPCAPLCNQNYFDEEKVAENHLSYWENVCCPQYATISLPEMLNFAVCLYNLEISWRVGAKTFSSDSDAGLLAGRWGQCGPLCDPAANFYSICNDFLARNVKLCRLIL